MAINMAGFDDAPKGPRQREYQERRGSAMRSSKLVGTKNALVGCAAGASLLASDFILDDICLSAGSTSSNYAPPTTHYAPTITSYAPPITKPQSLLRTYIGSVLNSNRTLPRAAVPEDPMTPGMEMLESFAVLKDFTSSQRRFIMWALEDLILLIGESGICPAPDIVDVIRQNLSPARQVVAMSAQRCEEVQLFVLDVRRHLRVRWKLRQSALSVCKILRVLLSIHDEQRNVPHMSPESVHPEENDISTGMKCPSEEGVEGDNHDNLTGSILPSAIQDAFRREVALDNAVLGSTPESSLRVEAAEIDQLLSSPVAFMIYVREWKRWVWLAEQYDDLRAKRGTDEVNERADYVDKHEEFGKKGETSK